MTQEFVFFAPAKINIALRVVGQREDGYHLLQTFMTFFPLYDRIGFLPTSGEVHLICEPPLSFPQEQNLVFRAAQSLLQTCRLSLGVQIHLNKKIPSGAGLGGGSSDAATVLLALNKIWKLNLPLEHLLEIGLRLGADIPIFLGQTAALVQGIGEHLTPFPQLPQAALVLVYPNRTLSTQAVFRALKGRLPTHTTPLSPLSPIMSSWQGMVSLLENDLEGVAKELEPVLLDIQSELMALGAKATCMTGSGSSMFGVFSNSSVAQMAHKQLQIKRPEWQIFWGMTFNQHPFATQLTQMDRIV
ncbi:MAG: 4-(cytidine 5'-diphospho)-2-C-methyl-D-erythritol kinase [Magnetococcus sp. DMHC-6]